MMLRRFFYLVLLVSMMWGCGADPEKKNEKKQRPVAGENIPEKEDISPEVLGRYRQQLAHFLDTALLQSHFNGGILIAKGGHILYEAYIGYANPLKKTDTITPHTAFHLASTSKPFTGITIMKLAAQGLLALSDPLTKYFPGFPYDGVTVEQLLTHRSGLPNYLYFMDDKEKWDQARMVTNNDVLQFLLTQQPAKSFNAGSRFHYCNTNYVLLALIVEKVTGVPFPQYLKQTIFDPLGMTDTYIYTPTDSARSVMSYQPSGAVWANDKYEYTYGDKNVYSTPRDLYRWDSALYRTDFVSQAILDSSFVPRSHEKPSVHNYGYGWRMLNLKNGKNVIYHNGKWHGFTPAFARLTEEKAVIIILGNRSSKNIYDAARRAYNIFGNYSQHEEALEEESSASSEAVGPNARKPVPVKKPIPQKPKPAVIAAPKPKPPLKAKPAPPKPKTQVKAKTSAAARPVTQKAASAPASKTSVKKKAGRK